MKNLFVSTIVLILLLLLTGCNETSNEATDPKASTVIFSDCKFKDTPEVEILEAKKDCLEYEYDGKSRLSIRHINAAFNCCPGDLYIEVSYEGNIITISEYETENACRCNCLYDLDYEIDDISPGKYIIRVVEPYVVPDAEETLEFEADLTKAGSGDYCVTRMGYPWNI